MANLRSTTVAANYEKFSKSQTDVGKEIIVGLGSVATDAQMKKIMAQLTLAAGDGTGTDGDGDDAFTVCAIAVKSDNTYVLKLQGTGTPDLSTVDGITLNELAVFEPAN